MSDRMEERPTIEMPAVTRHLASVCRACESDIARLAHDLDCFVRETTPGMPAVRPEDDAPVEIFDPSIRED